MTEGKADHWYLAVFVFGSRTVPLLLLRLLSKSYLKGSVTSCVRMRGWGQLKSPCPCDLLSVSPELVWAISF